ncbi:hypothetical protein R1flu_012276 [Riccia fluitans]|uniref:Coiled-coil domain-containing protein 12 n=1 Tax=Riccia fluitans TaxID=41844 RepID=A0ABD1ZCM4_9MARC
MAAEQDPLQERQARLQALRLAANLSEAPDAGDDAGAAEDEEEEGTDAAVEDEESEVNIKFRNYVPRDEQLQQLKILPPQPPKFEDLLAKPPEETNGSEDPLLSIAPKKANWDLRRDVSKKLEKLEKRTRRAIIELMQEEEKRRQAAAGVDEELE